MPAITTETSYELKEKVNQWVDRSFNFIQLDVVEDHARANGHEFTDCIQTPEISVLIKTWIDDCPSDADEAREEYKQEYEEGEVYDFEDWLEDGEYENAVMEHYYQSENYPMWNTLFEARDSMISHWIDQNASEIYDKIGFGVAEGFESLNSMLFTTGCGYDFYEAHWIPLYKLFYDR